MGVHKKGGLVGGFDQLRAPDAPTISVSAGDASVTVTITNPSDVGGGDITGYAVSALTGPIEDTTYTITVVSGNPSNHPYYNQGSTNKFAVDGSTATADVTLTLYKGHTYIFDQSDSSNSGHPLRFSTTANGTHGGGSEYTTGVTTSGTPGSAGAFTKIALATDAPDTLYYYCTNHAGMGWQANNKTSLKSGASGSSSPITVSSLTNDEAYNVRASAINAFGASVQSSATSATPASPRNLFYGGDDGNYYNVIQFIVISTTGNTTDFGDLVAGTANIMGFSSSTRGVFAGGFITGGSYTNVIQYVTIATEGDTTDFGDLSAARRNGFGVSSDTRGIVGGGTTSGAAQVDTIEYVTIASTGNMTDFGNLLAATFGGGGFQSPTRGIFGGGEVSGGSKQNVIQYITIASTGNATDFGDLSGLQTLMGGLSNNTRGLFGGGTVTGSALNEIQYVTIASTGNTTDFGDLTVERYANSGTADPTRGVFAGGATWAGALQNVMDYVTIASTGNASDFGDLLAGVRNFSRGMVGGAHGGLS